MTSYGKRKRLHGFFPLMFLRGLSIITWLALASPFGVSQPMFQQWVQQCVQHCAALPVETAFMSSSIAIIVLRWVSFFLVSVWFCEIDCLNFEIELRSNVHKLSNWKRETWKTRYSNRWPQLYRYSTYQLSHEATRLQNSLFLRRKIQNPSAFIKWETVYKDEIVVRTEARSVGFLHGPSPHSFSFLSFFPLAPFLFALVRASFPLSSLLFDERAWILDVLAKEEAVLPSMMLGV